MEPQKMKIKISLSSREVEFEGDLELIKNNFGEHLEDYLKAIKKEGEAIKEKQKQSVDISGKANNQNGKENSSHLNADSFGEFFSKFPRTLSNVDKMLLASYYLQITTEEKSFNVKDANSLLIEQGVSLSNAGVFNKHNIASKRVFKLSGKNFRVSDTGMDYIKSLIKID
jgi:hypothetical protein